MATKPKKNKPVPSDKPVKLSTKNWPVGSVAAQGDVLLVRIEPPKLLNRKSIQRTDRQIVPGNTRGSRHIVKGGKLYNVRPGILARLVETVTTGKTYSVDSEFIGPLIVTDKNTVLEHPEHGDHVYLEAGTYIVPVIYRNLDAESRSRRVVD